MKAVRSFVFQAFQAAYAPCAQCCELRAYQFYLPFACVCVQAVCEGVEPDVVFVVVVGFVFWGVVVVVSCIFGFVYGVSFCAACSCYAQVWASVVGPVVVLGL